MFRSHSKILYVGPKTNSDFRFRSFDLFPTTPILNASQEQKPDTGHFAETQFAEREGQFAENYSANCREQDVSAKTFRQKKF